MSRNPQYRQQFTNPELFLAELLRSSAKGHIRQRDEYVPFLKRATVTAVDVVGGQLENPSGNGGITHIIDGKTVKIPATVGPPNPRNSVKARIITEAADQFTGDDDLHVFWPFMPEHMSVPIKPGEHIYVVFEDESQEHGLWWSKVPGHEGTNFFKGEESFKKGNESSLRQKFDDSRSADNDEQRALDTDAAAGESVTDGDRLSSLYGD